MTTPVSITVNVNGTETSHDVEPRLLLVHFLRDVLSLTGTNVGAITLHAAPIFVPDAA